MLIKITQEVIEDALLELVSIETPYYGAHNKRKNILTGIERRFYKIIYKHTTTMDIATAHMNFI